MKSPKASFSPLKDDKPFSYDKISKIAQIIDESISKFNKKYFEASNLLNEMRFEFLGQMSSIIDNLSNRKSLSSTDCNSNTFSPIRVNSRAPKIAHNRSFRNKTSSSTLGVSKDTNESTLNKKQNGNCSIATFRSNTSQINKNSVKKSNMHESKASRNKTFSMNGNYKTNQKQIYSKTYNNNSHSEDSNKGKKAQNVKSPCILSKFYNHTSLIKAIHTLSESDVIDFNDKIKLKYLNEETYRSINLREICKKTKEAIKNRMEKLNVNCFCSDFYDKKYPSRTAQVGLNFLSSEKQSEILNDNTESNKTILSIIYNLLNDTYNPSLPCKSLYTSLFAKNKVTDIKSLFMKSIYRVIFIKKTFDKSRWSKLNELYTNCSEELQNISKDPNNNLCWVSFSLIEIYEYLSLCNANDNLNNKEYEDLAAMYRKIDNILQKKVILV